MKAHIIKVNKNKYLSLILFIFIFAVLAWVLLSFANNTSQLANANDTKAIDVILDGEALIFTDQEPVLWQDRVMIPVRVLAESWGIGVNWNENAKRIDLSYLDNHLVFDINKNEALINDNRTSIEISPIIRAERLLIPLRLVSEAFGSEVSWDEINRRVDIDTKRGFRIADIEMAQGVYQPEDTLISRITLENRLDERQILWIGYSLQDPLGKYYDLPAQSVNLNPGEHKTLEITWQIPSSKDLISGEYNSFLAIWDQKPTHSKNKATKLASFEFRGEIVIFRKIDPFEKLDTRTWAVSRHSIGRGSFLTANVQVDNNHLNILLPGDCLSSGEIQSKELMKHGRYEVRLKTPNVPSSITGFFLYRAPDYYQEIDIEIYNGVENKIYFVLYAGGKKTKEMVKILDFNPAQDFHTYTIDYYQQEVSFLVDGEKVATFRNGIPQQSMYLMLNAWYPDWVKAPSKINNGLLEVDWIAY